jgi:hypothetical protein
MKQYRIIPFTCIVMLCIGCAGSKKMRMPLAAIDRPIVDPKGTWSVAPSIGAYISTSDTVAYRGISYNRMLLPPVSYSFTDNLKIFSNTFFSPTLVWQLTKSPLVDTSARYKWQVALSAGTSWFGIYNFSGSVGLSWKKRLSPSVWYSGDMTGYLAKEQGKRISVKDGSTYNGIGFQLSQKANVRTGISLYYADFYPEYYHFPTLYNVGYSGYFTFQYVFTPWFSLDVGSGIYGYRKETGIDLSVGGQFFW